MRNKNPKYLATGLVAFALIASACGSSSGGDAKATTTAAGASTTKAAAAGTTAAGKPATTAAAVTTTAAPKSKLGRVSDTAYAGKGDFKIDLTKCPSDWKNDQGITATEIKIFNSLPKSGPLAGFGLLADGANSYFKYINDKGGIDGKKIVLDVKDDVYAADKTKANVDEAIAAKSYAAFMTILGTPNNLAIWDNTNKECMPQLLNGTGAAQWGDVDGHPWTTGMQIDYTTEAILWSEWIKTEFPAGAKVEAVTFNNDFGKSYSRGFKTAIKDSKITYHEELHEGNAPNLTNQFTNIEAAKPDVILLQTTGAFCTSAMAEIEKRALTAKVMVSGTCGSITQFFKPLLEQGLTGKDTYIVQTFKDVNDPEWANDEFVKLFKETATAQGLDPKQSTYATGWIFAWYMTEILKEAATYEGGLNRANIMLAARGIEKTVPLALPGLTTKMNGTTDAYLIEGGRIAQYKVADPKATGTFVKVTDVISKDGALGTYTKFNSIAAA
jgi:branched-chain amino acid transport system substrate-binding protein